MIAHDVLQHMFDLAHCLHPDTGVALAVTLDACERIAPLRRLQERRTGYYRFSLPEACLPQYAVFLASDARERDPEQRRPDQAPRYRPTPDDYLVRYLKCLVWWTMDRNACHVAVALGCFLYGYQPSDIANLAPELFNAHNIRRVRRRLAQQIYARFQHTPIFLDEHHTLHTRPPTAHERRLVHQSLSLFTPWGSPHLPDPVPTRSLLETHGERASGYLLETHFDGTSARSDWERIHALIDPTCAGLPRLIREYNNSFPLESGLRLEDPDDTLEIPCFTL